MKSSQGTGTVAFLVGFSAPELMTSSSRATWFTQNDVNALKAAGINTVRVPVSTSVSLVASKTF